MIAKLTYSFCIFVLGNKYFQALLNIHKFSFNLFQEHCMVAWKEKPQCIVTDPGFYTEDEADELFSFLEDEGLVPTAILVTHAHADHIYGTQELQSRYFGIPVYMNSLEMQNLDASVNLVTKLGLNPPRTDFKTTDIRDGDVICEAGMKYKVIETPGHSPGGVCFLEEEERIMFTGDTLFAGTIGRTDFLYSDYDQEISSIMEKLITLPGDIRIYPGHGGESTIGWERMNNPMLEPFNEAEEELDPDAKPIILKRQ